MKNASNTHIESTLDTNKTMYACPNIECACIPDRTLCGADGSIDITDFLTEAIAGPGYFTCDSASDSCDFSEPAMDDLIQSVFGDESITLQCDSGECMHYSEIPGYELPQKRLNKRVLVFGIFSVILFIVLVAFGVMFAIRKLQEMTNSTKLPTDDESYKLMAGHTPATLLFRDTSYSVHEKTILSGVQGVVHPGEIMAIMGASGAGKTSLLDILAHKNKDGRVDGQILVNGYGVTENQFKSIIGFVDQEDALMPTLTVYETILNSALLRLPKTMSRNAKRLRVLETMNELGIMDIRDQVIGWEGRRGISGGEKRRVAIACEMVTSPSILFLDEPTSGLDSFNAFNVIECLKTLAQNYKRTVIFTIHQPRSNIVALFNRLLLLSHGEVVYSGLQADCQAYFAGIGYDCPPGFNLADFLIDLTMTASRASRTNGHSYHDIPLPSLTASSNTPRTSEENDEDGELIPLSTREEADVEHPLQQNGDAGAESSEATSTTDEVAETLDLAEIVREYKKSDVSHAIIAEIVQSLHASSENTDEIPSFLYDSQKIGILEQFAILSGRTFKNLYRNPMLLLTHYGIALVLSGM